MKVHQIFPVPVYISKLERVLTKEELNMVHEYRKKTKKNEGNSRTTDSYVLEHKTLKNLKEALTKMVVDYFDKVVGTDNSIVPYITQSWINYTKTNEYHPIHYHLNSYVSGIFYIDAKKKVDLIVFNKVDHRELAPTITRPNIFDARFWGFFIKTGDVVLFPSTLRHQVPSKKGTNLRISLSFNVFFKGKIGNNKNLTELVLK